MQIYDILKNDHRTVLSILNSAEAAPDADRRKHILSLAHTELAMHSKAEEEVLYRPLRDRLTENQIIHHSFDEHDEIDKLLAKLQSTSAEDSEWMENLSRLRGVLERHIAKEEGEVFMLAQQTFSAVEAEEIGISMLSEKGKLGMPNPVRVAARKIKELVSAD